MGKKIKSWTILFFIIAIALLLKQIFSKQVSSVEDFRLLMESFGLAAPLVLTVIQAFQVVVPVLPGYLGCIVGAIAFGPWVGFLCNYVGISVGSIIAYYLGKKYGIDIVLTFFSEKQFYKWQSRIEKSKSYTWFLFLAILLPLFPDDFFCYFSGLIKMDSRKFTWIIILCKPWCIMAYSIIFGVLI
ncbi:MAG: VTT domain-containing protein [Clostridia bacterium]|nr:VTT domain-containing protein [Clostridia bacterium]